MEALEVFKQRRKCGLPESSSMALLAITGRMRSGEIADKTGLYGRMLHYALTDLRERGFVASEGPDKRMIYWRTEKGEEMAASCFQSASAFQG
jgi:predicted transcriptional regulator